MPYTPNTPQANQQIASTQAPILNNFTFIQTDAQQEHIFNGNTGPLGATQLEGTHIQASMPNQNLLSGSLPTGTNGVYYVNNGNATFYNGTLNLPLFTSFVNQGSNTAAAGASFQIIAAGNYMGLLNIFRISDGNYQLIQFWTNGSTLVSNEMASGGSSNITIILDGSNNIKVKNGSGSSQTFKWIVTYNTAP